MWTENFQVYKLGLEKAEESEITLPTFVRSFRKQDSSEKNIYFCFTDYTKAFDCVDHKNYAKFLKRLEYQTTFPVSWETCIWVKKQQFEPDMKQLVQNWESSTTRLYIVTLFI